MKKIDSHIQESLRTAAQSPANLKSAEVTTPLNNKENFTIDDNLMSTLQLAGWSPGSLMLAISSTPLKDSAVHDMDGGKQTSQPLRSKRSLGTPIGLSQSVSRVHKTLSLRSTPVPKQPIFIDLTVESTPPKLISDRDIEKLTENMAMNLHVEEKTTTATTTATAATTTTTTTNPNIKPKATFVSAKTLHLEKSDKSFSASSFTALTASLTSQTAPATTSSSSSSSSSSLSSRTLEESLINAADVDNPLPNGWRLLDHQKEAVIQCIKNARTILAHDMGLGKTVISLTFAKALAKVLKSVTVVLAPCTLAEVWARESQLLGFEMITCSSYTSTSVKRGRGSKSHDNGEGGADNKNNNNDNPSSDKEKEKEKDRPPQILILSWSKIPNPTELSNIIGAARRYVVLADEAHYMQTLKSQRTQGALALCLHSSCVGCVLATGTPMKNGRPCNIFPLLMAIRHPIARNKTEFEKRYCDAKRTRFSEWDCNGASNLKELRSVIGSALLRKTKEECLGDVLPQMQRQLVSVDVPEKFKREYVKLLMEMKAARIQRAAGASLEYISKLRILTSTAKAIPTCKIIREWLREDGVDKVEGKRKNPVVVFVWFKETSRILQNALTNRKIKKNNEEGEDENEEVEGNEVEGVQKEGGEEGEELCVETITGELAFHDRQSIIDRFQAGEIDVLILTYGVGATGITLTRSKTVILLDRPWTPGDCKQAEDRVRRIGQKSKIVHSVWIDAFPMDKSLDKILLSKDKRSEKVLASENAATSVVLSFTNSSIDVKEESANVSDATTTKTKSGKTKSAKSTVSIKKYFAPATPSVASVVSVSSSFSSSSSSSTSTVGALTTTSDQESTVPVSVSHTQALHTLKSSEEDEASIFNVTDSFDESEAAEANIMQQLIKALQEERVK